MIRTTSTSSLTRTSLFAINTRRPVVCGTFFSSAQHQLKASYSTTTLSSSLSPKPWHRLFPSQHNKTTTKATSILLALSRWARSPSNRTNLLYRGVPPTRGGGTYRHRTFREQYGWSERLDRIPNNFLIWGILGLNGFVFFMWQIAMTNAVSPCLYCYSWTVTEWNITSVWEMHRCMFTCRKTFFSTGGTSLKAECTYPH